jgi:hypothetical protein
MKAHQLRKNDFYFPILRLLDVLVGSASIEEMEQWLVEEPNCRTQILPLRMRKAERRLS